MMLTIRNLSKHFNNVQAVQNISFEIEKGSITSLIGPNGAGKTTLFDLTTGYESPDQGDVLLKNVSIMNLSPYEISRTGVSRTFQNLRLFKRLTVLENVLLGQKRRVGELFLDAVFRYRANSKTSCRSIMRAEELLAFVGLSPLSHSLAEELSYGQQKLLSLACCLAGDPDLLMLDEPVAGIQPEMIRRIEDLVRQLVSSHGKTIFLVEHDIAFVLRISDKVIVMDDGLKIAEDAPDEIVKNPMILDAYLS